MRLEFTRTKGAKDRRKRKRSGTGKRLRELESGSRSIANLGRGLNSIGNIVREARITAKYFGIDPAKRAALPEKIGLLHRVRGTREGVDLINATSRSGLNTRKLLFPKEKIKILEQYGPKAPSHVFIHHMKST